MPGAQALQNAAAAGRAASSAAGPVARTAGSAAPKGVSGAQPGGPSTRGPAKSESFAAWRSREAQSADRADRQLDIERIVRVVRSRINGQRSHTVMRLDPPELGSLRLQLDLRGSALWLRVEPTTELAHRLLSEDVSRLRDGLEASGVQLERIEVRPPALAPEPGEPGPRQHADTYDETSGGSAHTDAEHPQEQGRDSHLASPVEAIDREDEPAPATESLVNVVA
jgi:flagellar hook-length control protein FliK